MKILTNAKSIRQALRNLKPSRIAVAYVGGGWRDFVSTRHLREIVVSPTVGTNPKAVEELMQELGHENVHLLDELHSKFYIGANAALVGSCNLSDNGISDGRNLETAVVSGREAFMRALEAQFKRYRGDAQRRYPTLRAKMGRLARLQKLTNLVHSGGPFGRPTAIPAITDYRSNLDRIHVIWYQDYGDEVDERQVRRIIPKAAEVGSQRYFADWIQFREADKICPGDWLLCWNCNDDGRPRRGGRVAWMFVHDVVSRGLKSKDYPKLAGEAARKFAKCPPVPFKLDSNAKDAIRKVLDSGEFEPLISRDERPWALKPADNVTAKFLSAVKKEVAAKDALPRRHRKAKKIALEPAHHH